MLFSFHQKDISQSGKVRCEIQLIIDDIFMIQSIIYEYIDIFAIKPESLFTSQRNMPLLMMHSLFIIHRLSFYFMTSGGLYLYIT